MNPLDLVSRKTVLLREAQAAVQMSQDRLKTAGWLTLINIGALLGVEWFACPAGKRKISTPITLATTATMVLLLDTWMDVAARKARLDAMQIE